MTKQPRPLSEFVQVDTSAARADRMWSQLRSRVERPAARQRWAVPRALLLAAALLLSFAAGLVITRQEPRSGWAELRTSAGATNVRLQDGSALTLAPHTSLSVREQSGQSVQLVLESGGVECDVTHVPERAFSVVAAGYAVLVRGTRFQVQLSHERNELAVAVHAGRVEVREERTERAEVLLGAGQRWSVALEPRPGASVADDAGNMSPSSPLFVADAGVSLPSRAGPNDLANPAISSNPTNPTKSSRPARTAVRNRVVEQGTGAKQPGARILFDRANAARRRGELTAAAQSYEQLLREHGGDARAGLAAFELGRLRMDVFHDVHGAIEVLQLAARAAKEEALREDALARLVRAHQILRQGERCRSARAEYLQVYPTGTHVLAMLKACEDL